MNDQIKHYKDKLAYQWDSADLFENLASRNDIVIIDTRKSFAYEAEHIPGAVTFPHRTMNEQTTAQLDRSKTYICYCDGIGCNGSTRGALKMIILGFKTQELIGGLDWWKRDGYATEGESSVAGEGIQCAC
jgi:rhodanese-related sulfurtransferase